MPAGMPELAKESTSREVKSGRMKRSFSYAVGQGSSGKKCSALSTSSPNLADMDLLTMATKPAKQGRCLGCKYNREDAKNSGGKRQAQYQSVDYR